MPENTETRDLIDTAQEAVQPHELAPGLYAVRGEDGGTELLDIRHQLNDVFSAERPRTKTGRTQLTQPASYIALLNKHAGPHSEHIGSPDDGTISTVFDADAVDAAGWRNHTAVLTLRKSQDWKDWANLDGKLVSQEDFTDFLEQHLTNMVEPKSAEMLELAQTFRSSSNVVFNSSKRIKSGETSIEYREEVDAKAGAKGNITIPDTMTIALQPFEGHDVYKVTARFRYRIANGTLLLGYRLERPRDVLLDAFAKIVAHIEEHTQATVWI